MKRLFQFFSLFALVATFSVISASAQTNKQYQTRIPFDFSVGQKSYQAGDYVIKVAKSGLGMTILALEDKAGNRLQTTMVASNGEVSKEPVLVFNRYHDKCFLSKILTPETGLSVGQSDAEKQLANAIQNHSNETQVALGR